MARADDDLGPIFQAIEKELKTEGWAPHVTVPKALVGWARLANRARVFQGTIEEYTDELVVRDYLRQVVDRVPEEARRKVNAAIAPEDAHFRQNTIDDRGVIARYVTVQADAGWWWARVPGEGQLATWLVSRHAELNPTPGAGEQPA